MVDGGCSMNASEDEDDNHDENGDKNHTDDALGGGGHTQTAIRQCDVLSALQEAYIFHKGSSKEEVICLYIIIREMLC